VVWATVGSPLGLSALNIKGRAGVASYAKSDNPVWDGSRLIFQLVRRATSSLPLFAARLAKLWHDRVPEILKRSMK
jgi:hypothetical protein